MMTTTQIKHLICDQLNIIANATNRINILTNCLKEIPEKEFVFENVISEQTISKDEQSVKITRPKKPTNEN